MSRIFVDRISPYQSGSVQVDGLSIDTGSLATKVELNTYTASNDSKVDSLIAATSSYQPVGSYATTGANTFTGDQVISGSVTIGDGGRFSNSIALADNTQQNFFTLTDANQSGKPFAIANVGYQDYPSYGQYYEDIFAIEQADSVSFNYYNAIYSNGLGTTLNLQPSGSSLATIRLRDVGASSEATITANTITTSGTHTHTGDSVISGSLTVGNGGRFSNAIALADNTQQDFFSLTDANQSGKAFNIATIGYQDYPSYGQYYEDIFAIEQADSAGYNYYNGLYINGISTTMNLQPSGSSLATIRLRDVGAASEATITANTIATNGALTHTGQLIISGATEATDTIKFTNASPGNNAQDDYVTITGATDSTSRNYDVFTVGVQNYPGFGASYGDSWVVEKYDSTSYNFGSSIVCSGPRAQLSMQVSGSGNYAIISARESGNDAQVYIQGDKVDIQGKTTINSVLKLASSDPLPSGEVGDMAVSGSSLYFYDGSWRAVSLV